MTDDAASSAFRGLGALEAESWITLGILGFWTGLDMTAWLQILVSQPLVSAWLGGWAVGEPGTGLLLGLLLQGLASRNLPMGASPVPAAGPGAVAAGALAGLIGREGTGWGPVLAVPEAGSLAWALLVGLAVTSGSRPLVAAIPRHRGAVLRFALRAAAQGRPQGVIRANGLGALPSGLLGACLTLGGFGLGAWLYRLLPEIPAADGRWVAVPVLALGLGYTASLAGRGRARAFGVAALGLGLLAAGWSR